MIPPHNQRGSTLLVALVMLVLLTLIALSAMNSTTVSIQVVGNAQFREEATAAGQRAIEAVLSNSASLNTTTPPPQQVIDINQDGNPDYTVTFDAPVCVSSEEAKSTEPIVAAIIDGTTGAYACIGKIPCHWATWNITARVTDTATGASVVLHQGIRTIANRTTANNFCKRP